jgi:hypothetical protein
MELQKPNKLKPEQQTQLYPHKPEPSDFSRRQCALGSVNLTRALGVTNHSQVCYTFVPCSGVVQLVARQPLELVILVRVQAPEPSVSSCGQNRWKFLFAWRKFSKRNPTIARLPKPDAAWVGAQLSVRWDALL